MLASSACAATISAGCGFEQPLWRVVEPADKKDAEPLDPQTLREMVELGDRWIAYDQGRGGSTGNHDDVSILRWGDFVLLGHPGRDGTWTFERMPACKEPEMWSLREPDFVAAGSQATWDSYHGNNPVLIAKGSKLLWFLMFNVDKSSLSKDESFTREVTGMLVWAGFDLINLVGPERRGYRLFMDPEHEAGPGAKRGAIAHLIPWSARGPDRSRLGYTIESFRFFPSVIPRRLS